ncbi:biogenesis of lysosome-related organelles complex 1 subunit 4-like [Protopterus annectens]|uniref:biogenesis of lysosome-related organelles complex 1 subunit 4-like n=1 Tax=Protopterus annectens TaxID=7888 RepID=UPI001CFC3A29|nr:biogenesis of lysosome-related organelles complex 1 subunit 4-like [Protopterus annectens]
MVVAAATKTELTKESHAVHPPNRESLAIDSPCIFKWRFSFSQIRSDSSQVVNENLPEILAKASEMKQIYKKIDKLEAFVKMVGNSVAILEEQVTEAETETGPFPTTFRKFMRSISKMSSPKRKQPHYESAPIFRTEDYFPCRKEQPET